MLSATFRLCLLWLRRALLLLAATVAVSVASVWKSGDCVALVPTREWVPHNSRYSNNGAAFYPGGFNGIAGSLFKPSRCVPGDLVYPPSDMYFMGGLGRDPFLIVRRFFDEAEPLRSYRIGIFWIGKPEAIRLLNGTDAERAAIRHKLVEDACFK